MKILRGKRAKKIMAFYRNYFEFRAPYQVLIDGTFCYAALNFHVRLKEMLPKYLDSEVKLCTTACVVAEARSLGKLLPGPLEILGECHVSKCQHKKKPVPATECIQSMVKDVNCRHYLIGTQDKSVQDTLRQTPGVPILFIDRTICLDPPSDVSKQVEIYGLVGLQQGVKLSYEEVVLKQLKKKLLDKKPRPEFHKKKKKGGANPLSRKKRKTVTNVVPSTSGGVKTSRKRRKRIRIAPHVKEHLKNHQP